MIAASGRRAHEHLRAAEGHADAEDGEAGHEQEGGLWEEIGEGRRPGLQRDDDRGEPRGCGLRGSRGPGLGDGRGHDAHHEQRETAADDDRHVHDDREPAPMMMAHVGGRERDEREPEKKGEIGPEEARRDGLHLVDEAVMGEPVHADDDETQEIGADVRCHGDQR